MLPSALDQLGLVPAVKALVHDIKRAGKIAANLTVSGQERRLLPETELGLYRIIQEAVRNVRKHAEASYLSVHVDFFDNSVRVSVQDDGRGFEVPRILGDFTVARKLGLIGMQERAQLCNGDFAVQSKLGAGTTIVVQVSTEVLLRNSN